MTQNDTARVAIVDDYAEVAQTIAVYIRSMGCKPSVFTNPLEFLEQLSRESFDIVITDIRMPQMDGLTVLKEVRLRSPKTAVIVVSAHSEKKDAIEALRLGAYDFFEKPVSRDELEASVKRTVSFQQAIRERDRLKEQLSYVSEKEAKRWNLPAFIGNDPSFQKVIHEIRLIQTMEKTSVLVLGESGTGKELVARAIHSGCSRRGGPFIPVNCAAIPDELAESVLFGHVRGAFTGAAAEKKGAFELADGGTLFLDEIGDMQLGIQAKLLRVLEDGVVDPVGATRGRKVDVRIVAATNVDITSRIEDRAFRSDLYHRIATFTISIPALRERKGDVSLLVQHFVDSVSTEMGLKPPAISDEAMDMLNSYQFPGNVRELRNIVERALIVSSGGEIMPEHVALDSNVRPAPSLSSDPAAEKPADLPLDLAEVERLTIARALKQTDGNVSAASRLLGISRNRLYRITSA